jgi:CRISPR/Cas system-associated protein Cas7 (RAMP superfamily)
MTFETSANSASCHVRLNTIENSSHKKVNNSYSITKNEYDCLLGYILIAL